jgi:anti-sigma28 factor (negative regulator of flagellin synthesis)
MEEEDLVQINQLDADMIAELEADEALYYGYQWDADAIAELETEEEDLVQINQLDADTIAELEADEALYYGYQWDADAIAELETEETQHEHDSSFAGVEHSGKEAVDSSSENSNKKGFENDKVAKLKEQVKYNMEATKIIANDTESPTAKVESIMLIATIEVKEEHEVCTSSFLLSLLRPRSSCKTFWKD